MSKSNNDRNKERNLDLVYDDRWKKKGGEHSIKHSSPKVCEYCEGYGVVHVSVHTAICPKCNGEGVIYDWKRRGLSILLWQ